MKNRADFEARKAAEGGCTEMVEYVEQPIPCWVIWPQSRLSDDGSYTSEASRLVAEKIVSNILF